MLRVPSVVAFPVDDYTVNFDVVGIKERYDHDL